MSPKLRLINMSVVTSWNNNKSLSRNNETWNRNDVTVLRNLLYQSTDTGDSFPKMFHKWHSTSIFFFLRLRVSVHKKKKKNSEMQSPFIAGICDDAFVNNLVEVRLSVRWRFRNRTPLCCVRRLQHNKTHTMGMCMCGACVVHVACMHVTNLSAFVLIIAYIKPPCVE